MVLSAALSSLGFVRFLESGSRGSYEFCAQRCDESATIPQNRRLQPLALE